MVAERVSATVLERPMWECAARGCEKTVEDGIVLTRVSPKGPGQPFVGLCDEHLDKTVIIKDVPDGLR